MNELYILPSRLTWQTCMIMNFKSIAYLYGQECTFEFWTGLTIMQGTLRWKDGKFEVMLKPTIDKVVIKGVVDI